MLPAADGSIAQVLFGLEEEAGKSRDLFRPGALPGLAAARRLSLRQRAA